MTKKLKSQRTEGPTVKHALLLVLWFFGSSSFASPGILLSQDTVIHSTAADPAARIKKSGTILEFTGSELRLRSTLGTEETIPAARVVEIQTRWTGTHEAGRTARTAPLTGRPGKTPGVACRRAPAPRPAGVR